MRDASPLRYPGGKWRVTPLFERIISRNRLENCHYIEPYAGGASLALSLLFTGRVAEIHLNDLDPAVYAFWHCVLERNREFVQLLGETQVTTEEWRRQKAIYAAGRAAGGLALGFATFFLNRTNHSGILNGGMIGGKRQLGEWRLDARFNRPELERRIKRIGAFKTRIHLSRRDAVEFLLSQDLPKRSLVYLDPPYYRAGRDLYFNAYEPADHAVVRRCVGALTTPWIVSYDDVPEIRRLYRDVRYRRLTLLHTARSARPGKEILFFAPDLEVPRGFSLGPPHSRQHGVS
jgi:DNA adenine methylase